MIVKLKARYISLSGAFLISVLIARCNSDTLSLLVKADSLFHKGYYYEAGNYYQKAYFYSNSIKNKTNLILKKIACLKQLRQFKEVDNIVSKMLLDNLSDSLLLNFLSEAALCSYLANDYNKAESYLIQLEYRLMNKDLLTNTYFIYSLILNEQQRWQEAKEKLKMFVIMFKTDNVLKNKLLVQIDSAYHPKNYPKLKKPVKAKILSSILPGLGQMYSGAVMEGIGSLALNVFALSVTGAGIYFKYYITGIVTGNFLFGKLYLGGGRRAEFLVLKKNYQRLNKFNNGLKNFNLSILK